VSIAEEIGLLAISVVVVAMILFWVATRAHLGEEDPETEKPGFRHWLRQTLRFMLGPFPLSVGLHVVVLLFLLFAEARGLVPLWHPVYRQSYSVDALRAAASRAPTRRAVPSRRPDRGARRAAFAPARTGDR